MPSPVGIAAPDGSNGDLKISSRGNEVYRHIGKYIDDFPPEKPYSIALASVPVTVERLPYYQKDDDRLMDPGTARVNIAATNEHPNGTTEDDWAKLHSHETVVQQHSSYFDPDGDGVIWPFDTYRGCRAWGWNIILALFAAFVIHGNLSYPTSPSLIPDPAFRICVKNAHKCKHGSDSMTYDNEGRFRPQNYEDFFAKYDAGNKGGLDVYDLARAHKGQRMAMDFFGWSASFLEWTATYLLLWPEDGVIKKDDVRGIFDGSIFQKKADEYARKRAKQGKNASNAAWYGRDAQLKLANG